MHSARRSKGIIQILFRVKQVPHDGRRQFLKGLAHGAGGVTLVFMHHNDALRSGSSYQNCAHIAVEDCVEVRNVRVGKECGHPVMRCAKCVI